MKKSSIVIVALIALASGFLLSWHLASNKLIKLEAGSWYGNQSRALPEFELVDHRGNKLTNENLRGKWSLMFFGYTRCPDICPTTLQDMSSMVKAIDDPDVSDAINIYFVSVDPERDTPEVLASYVPYFNANFIGATASMEKLKVLTNSLGIAHDISNKSEGSRGYDVSHSAAIVLINPQVEFSGLFGAPHDAMAMALDMTRIVEYN